MEGTSCSSSSTSDGGQTTVKFLCSHSGKILPRCIDGKLRYLGGETCILSVDRSIPFSELCGKLKKLCGWDSVGIRCQLPTDDLEEEEEEDDDEEEEDEDEDNDDDEEEEEVEDDDDEEEEEEEDDDDDEEGDDDNNDDDEEEDEEEEDDEDEEEEINIKIEMNTRLCC